MSLETEIKDASQEIATDGFKMSIGELMSLYKENDLIINSEFQKYFQWSNSQKTKFIESNFLVFRYHQSLFFTTVMVLGN